MLLSFPEGIGGNSSKRAGSQENVEKEEVGGGGTKVEINLLHKGISARVESRTGDCS